jgi:hypothetical protein
MRCVGDGHGRSGDLVSRFGVVGMDRNTGMFIRCSILIVSMSYRIYNTDLL